MCLKEMERQLMGWRIEILGTDISNEVLDRAKAGTYTQFEVQRGLPIQLLLKYFTQQGESWTISPALRSMVQWKKFNLLDSFASFGQFDIVFCRNVLIYFDQPTKVGHPRPHLQGSGAGRLSGARRRRNGGRPHRRLQAGPRSARPLRSGRRGCRAGATSFLGAGRVSAGSDAHALSQTTASWSATALFSFGLPHAPKRLTIS